MEALVFFALMVACLQAIHVKPEYKFTGSRSCQGNITQLVQWIAGEMMGGDAWIFRLEKDPVCGGCPLLQSRSFTAWPPPCTKCTEPFWQKMKKLKSCKQCRHKSKHCQKCQRRLRLKQEDETVRRRKYELPIFRQITLM